ncbi:DUF5397 domain-containing protein [Kluyvera cryocrescens]|uniref:DUF5397 family protein n=1 Tax=Kluyvera cryocrescens TaxID=580 RepID=UPI002DB97ED9|nr:DUF5397 family protein [Kluyvera cryocrescens]MEB7712763.1 DUF5397 domain-containing protein [Kluyvera cryocrescens]
MEKNKYDVKYLKGTCRSFGDIGPVYQIGDIVRILDDGDCLMEITLVESNEVIEYLLSNILKDPSAI